MSNISTTVPTHRGASSPKNRWRGTDFLKGLLGVALGSVVGILGTIQHLNLFWVGEAPGIGIPWGAMFGLIFVGVAVLWVGLRLRSILAALGVAMGAYTLAVLMSFWPGTDQFAVPITARTWELIRWPVIAELTWLIGIPVVSVVMMFVVSRRMRAPKPGTQLPSYNKSGSFSEPQTPEESQRMIP